MGLDMTLSAKVYIGWPQTPRDKRIAEELTQSYGYEPSQVTFQVVYWRKANAIHRWFVENVPAYTDDCGDYPVSPEDLTGLLSLCRSVLADPDLAAELLPTQSGVFFGSTEYDEDYFADLKHTIAVIDAWLANPIPHAQLYYHSSW